MKRLIILGLVVIGSISIIVGNTIWNNKVELTTKHAEERISSPQNKDTNIQTGDNKGSEVTENDTATDGHTSTTGNSSTSDTQNNSPSTSNRTDNPQSSTNQPGMSSNLNGGENELSGNKTDSQNQNSNSTGNITIPSNANIGSSGNSTGNTGSSNQNNKPTVTEIKNKYSTLFNELKAQETSKIDQLVIQAKSEYVSGNISLSKLITKYETTASAMEQNADNSFNMIYQQLEYDLEYYGYSLNEAQEFRRAYSAEKQERLSRIISQLQDF